MISHAKRDGLNIRYLSKNGAVQIKHQYLSVELQLNMDNNVAPTTCHMVMISTKLEMC